MFERGGPTLTELARQALSSTRHGYDLLAPKFDRTPFRTPDLLLDAMAPLLGPPGSVARGIDLCCGTGAGLRVLRPLCRELVVGVDFSFGMLREARRAHRRESPRALPPVGRGEGVEDAGAPRARLLLVQQDVLTMGLQPRFELATLFGALGHLRPCEQPAFLAQVRACLAPRGRLAFALAPVPPPWSPVLWLAAAFDAAIWLRNVVRRPPFHMYYLAWPLRRTLRRLDEAGFDAEALPVAIAGRRTRLRLVVATRR